MNKQKPTLSLFAIILLLATSGQIAADLYLPSLPFIAKGLKSPIHLVQLSLSLYMIGLASSQLIYGPLSDGIGRKKPIIIGFTLLVIGSIICLTASSIKSLIIGRCIQGMGAGCSISLSRAILRDIYTGKHLAKLGSYLAVCSVAIMASAPLVGGYIVSAV